MLRNYLKMKKNEWKIKAHLYGMIAAIIDDQKELLSFLQKSYEALKDIPADEIKSELVRKIAEIVHNENQK